MFRFLLGLAGSEVRLAARRAATTAILFAISGLLLAVSLLAFLVAGFIFLSERYDPLTAALIVAGFTLVSGLIFLLVAQSYRRRRQPPPGYGALAALAGGLSGGSANSGANGMGAASPSGFTAASPTPPPAPSPPFQASTVVAIAAGAALVGLILGRRV